MCSKKMFFDETNIFRRRIGLVIVTVLASIIFIYAIIKAANVCQIDRKQFFKRSETTLLPPKSIANSLEFPVKRVIISHTTTAMCTTLDTCLTTISKIQENHFNRGFNDIDLNFLVGSDGRVYEGVGYSHTFGLDNDSVCISLIGDFNEFEAPEQQLFAVQRFISDGVNDNKIDPEYKLYGQVQINGCNSPGRFVYDAIKTWKHWTNEV